MGFEPIENDRVVMDVQWLFGANDSEASANVIAQADGYRWIAIEVVVGVGCINGIVVDLDGGETYVFSSSCERISSTMCLINSLLRTV